MNFTESTVCSRAIALLNILHQRRQKYDGINRFLSKEIEIEPMTIHACDEKLESAIVDFLDWILGDEIASYWLYECDCRPDGGRIEFEGKDYPIKTIDDVIAYVAAMKARANA